ncbi:MAG: biotin/lipoyl-binding protein [Actinobacteria bacterium]|nr:biotin/lipoyl-binding protein [Actinomycetota bacterium]
MSGPFDSVLVANRGEIARRIFRTARSVGLRCIAVFVEADAGAPFVTEADEAVRLDHGYLDGRAIIAAAVATGAKAVHPGYGFLAENAEFAQSVIDAGLVWVGPAPEVMAAMGDKIAAKRVAAAAGVPSLVSSNDPTSSDEVGFPMLVKASAGGGGKGMRLVESLDELAEAVASAQREAGSSFGDDTVFLERYVAKSRHIEIQILGDSHGNLVHLGERECSIQRRHQKIIEESPSPVVDAAMRTEMGEAALRLAREMGYESAGTVEFLVDDKTREFFFLEVNTRIQVEHPVTEEVTGIDIVREQLRIASGEPLGFEQHDISFDGHAIEARLCAEDPTLGFLPATGTLHAFEPSTEPQVRWDSGVVAGSVVGVDFDPMLAKVIATGATRSVAAAKLALALERLHLGGVVTNREFLVSALRDPVFLAGDATTDFVDNHTPVLALPAGAADRACIAAAMWLQHQNRSNDHRWAFAPSNWRNARLPSERVQLQLAGADACRTIGYKRGRDGVFITDDGAWVRVHGVNESGIDIEVDGRRSFTRVSHVRDVMYVQTATGTVTITVVPRFAVPGHDVPGGGLTAPMPGSILEVRISLGDHVVAGQTLLILEAMKMEHHIAAPFDGKVTDVGVSVGDQVDNGALLLTIEQPDPTDSDRGGQ